MAEFSVNPTRFDPYKNFKFRIKWDGRYVAGVSKISGLRRTTEVIQHREGGDPNTSRKSPGHTEFVPITLERGVTHDPEFENWANKVWSLSAGLGAEVSLKDFRKDIVLELYNEAGQLVLAYKVYRCWVRNTKSCPTWTPTRMRSLSSISSRKTKAGSEIEQYKSRSSRLQRNHNRLCWPARLSCWKGQSAVMISFREGFGGGLVIALCAGLYLIWLWQPERQVRRHTENFFRAIERKNWDAAADFVAADYQDQWGDNRERVLERLREGFRYVRGPRIIPASPRVQVESPRAVWSGKIALYSSDDDVMEVLDQRVNSLPSPFELEWHHLSGRPWDWKLARVSNPAFEIPADVY